MRINTEAVITEVCLRPVLWDRKHKFYRNKLHRDYAWKEILMELVPEYDSLSEDQRIEADKKIQQRWRTARDTYKKEKNDKTQESDPANRKKKKYSYFEILTFLDKDNAPITDDIDTTPSVVYVPMRVDSKEGILQESQSPPPTLEPAQEDFRVNQYNTSSSTAFEVPLLERIRSNESELEIEDLAFFQSLQPSLKRFTRRQKLMFRTRVLNVVMELENEISIKKEIDDSDD